MTGAVLADALGPRARRRVAVLTAVAVVVLVALLVVAVRRFADEGQLESERWEPLTQWGVLRFLLLGLVATLKVAAVAMVLTVIIGGLMALGRLARNAPVRWLAGGYVEIFRAIPVLLLIYFMGRGLPKLDVHLDFFWYLVFGLVAYNSAVLAEIFRAGILSLERGQTEAAYSVGLSYWQTMSLVVVPQALRRMIPASVGALITLLKDTSLGVVLPYEEFLRRGQIAGEFGKNQLQTLMFVAVVYIVVNATLSQLARRLEVRQRRRFRAGSIEITGVEELTAIGAAARSRV